MPAKGTAVQLLTLKEFRARHFAWSRERFLEKYVDPFLLIEFDQADPDGKDASAQWATTSTARRVAEIETPAQSFSPDALVATVAKTDRNRFPNMITVGRAPTNDIVIRHPAVSKFHAFFQKTGSEGQLSVFDAESRFGTYVGGRGLGKSQGAKTTSPMQIAFSEKVRATYLLPGGFHDVLTYGGQGA